MGKKIVDLYLFPHIQKFAAKTYGEGKFFNYRYPLVKNDKRNYHQIKLHSRLDRKVRLQVQMHNPTPQNQYALMNVLEKEFKENLFNFVSSMMLLDVPAKVAINCFYMLYGITDADYNIETAYRAWHRSKQKACLREATREQIKSFIGWAA